MDGIKGTDRIVGVIKWGFSGSLRCIPNSTNTTPVITATNQFSNIAQQIIANEHSDYKTK